MGESHSTISDEELIAMMRTRMGIKDPGYIKNLDKKGRNRLLFQLRDLGGGVTQISRITGVTAPTVCRILKGERP